MHICKETNKVQEQICGHEIILYRVTNPCRELGAIYN